MDYIGKKIIQEMYNTLTMTARNSTASKKWIIVEDLGDKVKAELKYTNEYMYSGEGHFSEFSKSGLNYSDNYGSIRLVD